MQRPSWRALMRWSSWTSSAAIPWTPFLRRKETSPEVQTLAFGSDARVGAVAWGTGEGDGRLDTVRHLEAYPLGTAAMPLALPDEGFCRNPMRISSYRGNQAAALFLACDEIYAFSPATGVRTEDLSLPQEVSGYVFHTLPDGTSAGADTTDVVLWRPGQSRRRVLNPCPGRAGGGAGPIELRSGVLPLRRRSHALRLCHREWKHPHRRIHRTPWS